MGFWKQSGADRAADELIRVALRSTDAVDASPGDAQAAAVAAIAGEAGAGASASLAVPKITAVSAAMPPPLSTLSTPRSAPSDGELGLGHVDETSSFSEQAWDNYLVNIG